MKWFKALSEKNYAKYLLSLIVIWKALDTVVSIISKRTIPYLGFFSYGQTMLQYGLTDYLRALTNFDGIFYIRIALNGYSTTEQAYFPMYSLLIKAVNIVVGNPIVTGVLISLTSFILGALIFRKYLNFLTDKKYIGWAMLFLLLYPTSYYFGVMYTEGLFFFFLVGTLYFHRTKVYWLSMLFALGASLTKVIGASLVVPIGISLLVTVLHHKERLAGQWKTILVILSSLSGLGLYCLYLWRTVGDPLYFIRAQESFGANRSSHLITPVQVVYRYLKIFFTADYNFQYLVAVIEIIFFTMAVSLICFDLWKQWKAYRVKQVVNADRLGLALFSTANILVPSATGTLTAMPRYSLMSLTILLVLAEIRNPKVKILILVLFVLVHISFFALFIQGYYIT